MASVPAIWLVGALHPSTYCGAQSAVGQKWATCTPGMLSLQGLMGPTVSWGTLGAHLATAKGARGARVVS